MEINYKISTIYIDRPKNLLYFVPVFDSERGIIEMETFLELSDSAADEELENTTFKVLDLCHTKEPADDNYLPPIQKIKKTKSYKKATENIRMIEVVWDKGEGYSIGYYKREKNGYFDLINRIELGERLVAGDLAKAIRSAIDLAK